VPLPPEKRVVRIAAVLVVAAGAAVPAAMAVPARLPAVATGSALLLYVERALAIFAVLVLALVFLYRGWHGQLPRSVSREARSGKPFQPRPTRRTTGSRSSSMRSRRGLTGFNERSWAPLSRPLRCLRELEARRSAERPRHTAGRC
jgi:hypothetical protein